jgi:adenylylsulfate kinase-like enzyme
MATLIWLTGLAGAGKTSIATSLYELIKVQNKSTVMLDGDILRDVLGNSKGYKREDRLHLALTYAQIAKMLLNQDINVICSTISLFNEIYEWNRINIINYIEVYVKVPKDILVERDKKNLYSRAIRGEINDVVGIDIPFDEPVNAHIIIDNDSSKSIEEISLQIYQYYCEVMNETR